MSADFADDASRAVRIRFVLLVEERTLGAAWLGVARRILSSGADTSYDGRPTKELFLVTIRVAEPDPDDAVIAELADPYWLDWMRRSSSSTPIRSTSARRC